MYSIDYPLVNCCFCHEVTWIFLKNILPPSILLGSYSIDYPFFLLFFGMELLEVEKEVVCGKKITVFTIHGDDGRPAKYLIGVQVSKILRRQTFNLYRSLKLKGVGVIRATPQQVGFLLRTQSLPPNSHSVSLIPYKGAKDFILENFKGKIDEPTPTASKSAQPSHSIPSSSFPSSPSTSRTPPRSQQATQLQKILQLQLKRAYERDYSTYSSGNESSFSSSAALSSDSEADHLYQRRPPPLSTPPPTFHSPVLPSDELKRYQRPSLVTPPTPPALLKQQQQYQQQQEPSHFQKRESPPELEAGEVLASFFRRTQQQQQAATQTKIPPTTFTPPPLVSPPPTTPSPHFPFQKLMLPPITSLPPASPMTALPSITPTTTITSTTTPPTTTTPEPVRNPKHDLSFLLG